MPRKNREKQVPVTASNVTPSELIELMNLDELQKKLLLAARAECPNDAVPYAFEKRIMARATSQPIIDITSLWSRILWRATAPCVAIMVLLGVWTMLSGHHNSSAETLAADLEDTVLAPFDDLGETW